jgi:hypothetical protein
MPAISVCVVRLREIQMNELAGVTTWLHTPSVVLPVLPTMGCPKRQLRFVRPHLNEIRAQSLLHTRPRNVPISVRISAADSAERPRVAFASHAWSRLLIVLSLLQHDGHYSGQFSPLGPISCKHLPAAFRDSVIPARASIFRTVPVPDWVKHFLDDWFTAAQISTGKLSACAAQEGYGAME